MWWKSSRLVADDVINEQISDKHLVHSYEIWHMTIAPIRAHFISSLVFGSLYFSPARSISDIDK